MRLPRRTLAFALAAGLAGAACAPSGAGGRPNLLLITVDTLRADHLGCYGYGRDTSPNLDRLAAESLLFERAASPRAKTTPAVVSLLSGLYPHDHGVRDLAAPLDRPVPLLQERLREAGWFTAAIVGNFVLTRERSGLDRGFDLWIDELPDVRGVPPHDAPQRTARSLTDAALEVLEEREGPWFLWLHYMDPHGAYEPPREHDVFSAETADPIPREEDLPPSPLHRFRLADYNVPEEAFLSGRPDANRVRALYDGEIHYADAEIGRVLDRLRERGALEGTLVVVTADHGESLGEHRYWFEHGAYAYEATCHVPLIVHLPGSMERRAEPGVCMTPVSLVDLAPTLLELLGLPPLPLPSLAGTSRAALLAGHRADGRALFYEKVEGAQLDRAVQIKAARLGDWKLIRRYAHVTREGRRELVALSDELYDLASDPLEAVDLAADPPEGAPLAQLRGELLRFAAADEHFPELDELLRRRREALEREDPEALRALEALGY
jgi:arylsulfatase